MRLKRFKWISRANACRTDPIDWSGGKCGFKRWDPGSIVGFPEVFSFKVLHLFAQKCVQKFEFGQEWFWQKETLQNKKVPRASDLAQINISIIIDVNASCRQAVNMQLSRCRQAAFHRLPGFIQAITTDNWTKTANKYQYLHRSILWVSNTSDHSWGREIWVSGLCSPPLVECAIRELVFKKKMCSSYQYYPFPPQL